MNFSTETGGALTSISLSPNGELCCVGGRDVLKTFSTREPPLLAEKRNIRYSLKKGLDLSASDVRWHPTNAALIASGSTSGAVLVWDLTRPRGSEYVHKFKHARTVNRVAWHGAADAWLLTGSQDGTARLWDARVPNAAAIVSCVLGYRYCTSAMTNIRNLSENPGARLFLDSCDAVRDVQWDPFHPLRFVAALEDGSARIFDVRRADGPMISLMAAHDGPVTCLQWHPTQPNILATGGRDRLVKLWAVGGSVNGDYAGALQVAAESVTLGDVATTSSTTLQQLSTVQTIAPVGRLSWRAGASPAEIITVDDADDEDVSRLQPSHEPNDVVSQSPRSAVDHRRHHGMSRSDSRLSSIDFHLASCASLLDNNVTVWDIRQPAIPAAVFQGHRDVVTSLAWIRRSDAESTLPWLLTGCKDGRLSLLDPQKATRPHWTLRTSAVTFSSSTIAWSAAPTLRRSAYWDDTPTHSVERATLVDGRDGQQKRNSQAEATLSVAVREVSDLQSVSPSNEARMASAARAPNPPCKLPQLVVKVNTVSSNLSATSVAGATAAHDAFDPPDHVFALLALSYVTEGAAPAALCTYNAAIAAQLGLHVLASMWRCIAVLWGPLPAQPMVVTNRVLPLVSAHDPASDCPHSVLPDGGNNILNAGDAPAGDGALTTRTDEFISRRDVECVDDVTPRLQLRLPSLRERTTNGYIPGLLEALAHSVALASAGDSSVSTVQLGQMSEEFDDESSDGGSVHRHAVRGAKDGDDAAPARDRGPAGAAEQATQSVNAVTGGVSTLQVGEAAVAGGATMLTTLGAAEESSWHALRMNIALEVLAKFADRGDVQTCVTLARVLGDEVEARVGLGVVQQWIEQYIELLHRLRLWAPASTVMARCSVESVRRKNQLYTSITASCAQCEADLELTNRAGHLQSSAPVELGGAGVTSMQQSYVETSATHLQVRRGYCRSCRLSLATCAFCDDRMLGLVSWCQGCGHACHAWCAADWFATSTLCPSGCGHVCFVRQHVEY